MTNLIQDLAKLMALQKRNNTVYAMGLLVTFWMRAVSEHRMFTAKLIELQVRKIADKVLGEPQNEIRSSNTTDAV